LSSDDERGVVYAARSAISKQSWKMHDEYFQIAFCSFANAH